MAVALACAPACAPAYAEASSRAADDVVPDFGSAKDVPSDSDYQITDDGYLIYGGDMVFSCESVLPENYTAPAAYEEQARICERSGFPPGERPAERASLPKTGGVPSLLAPVALTLAALAVVHAVAPR